MICPKISAQKCPEVRHSAWTVFRKTFRIFFPFGSRAAVCEVHWLSEQFGGLSKNAVVFRGNSSSPTQLSVENGCAFISRAKLGIKGRGDLLQKRYIRPNNGNQGRLKRAAHIPFVGFKGNRKICERDIERPNINEF